MKKKKQHIWKQLIFGANESSHGLHVAIPTTTAEGWKLNDCDSWLHLKGIFTVFYLILWLLCTVYSFIFWKFYHQWLLYWPTVEPTDLHVGCKKLKQHVNLTWPRTHWTPTRQQCSAGVNVDCGSVRVCSPVYLCCGSTSECKIINKVWRETQHSAKSLFFRPDDRVVTVM